MSAGLTKLAYGEPAVNQIQIECNQFIIFMKILFSGEVFSCFHTLQLTDPGTLCSEACWRRQINGLCGAAESNQLSLYFGPHTARVNLRAVKFMSRPAVDSSWEEIVEASLKITSPKELFLTNLDGETYGDSIFFDKGNYRVRFSAVNFNATEDVPVSDWLDFEMPPAVEIEKYELLIWPEAASVDEVIRATSIQAISRHVQIVERGT